MTRSNNSGAMPTTLVELMGLRVPGGPLYTVVLPGAMMPELFALPAAMCPPGTVPITRRDLAECYHLSDESYCCVTPQSCGKTDAPPPLRVSWLDVARQLRPHEQQAPPAHPDFWDLLHAQQAQERGEVGRSQRLATRALSGQVAMMERMGAPREEINQIRALARERGVIL